MTDEEILRQSIEAMNGKPFEGLKTISTEDIFKIAYIVHFIQNVEQTRYDKLKEAIKDLKANMKSYCDANCPYSETQREFMCKACMMGDAIDMVDNYTEELV